ncbi:MAG: hypothetical protein AAFW68_10595, partial [Pseudomonadota bacterium]
KKGLFNRLDLTSGKEFAVSIEHGGERYHAVKNHFSHSNSNVCSKDRTGTVMMILSELFVRSQSEDFLKAPESNVFRTQ